MKRLALPLLAALGAAFTTVAPAGAENAATAPCTTVAVKDPAGDQLVFPTVLGGLTVTGTKGPDNTDVREVYFNHRDGVTTANISITNLNKAFPAESRPNNGVQWAVWFDLAEVTHYVKAVSDGTAVTYKHGGYSQVIETPEGSLKAGLTEMGDTTGTFTEGPNGLISIVIPPSLKVNEGTKLDLVSARVAFKKKDADNSYTADRAPDAAADDKSHTVAACPAEAPAGGTEPSPLGEQAPTPPQDPPVQPQPAPQPQQQPAPSRSAPQVSFTMKPGRDPRPPFAFRTLGKLVPPSGADRTAACQGRVSIQVKNGRKTVSNRRTQVRPDCTFSDKLKIANRKRLGKARTLRVIVTFQGNQVLLPQKAKARSVRVR